MTIKQYLFCLEFLKERCEEKHEKYIRLTERAESPVSSLNTDGTPHGTGKSNTREKLLIKSSMALEEYLRALDHYRDFRISFNNNLLDLDPLESLIMQEVYIKNMGLPLEDRFKNAGAVLKMKPMRVKAKQREAKEHLAEILKRKGIEIEY